MKELFELQSSQLGDGRILARWGCKGSALCAVGTKRHFLIFNKEGRETHSYPLGPATGPAKSQPKDGVCVNDMQWSPDDNLLAVLPAASDFFFVWDAAAKTFDKVALGAHAQQQDLRVVCWSADSTKCAIGASKGAMLLFDVSIRKILHNVQGVHDRGVVCAAMVGGIVVTGGEDNKAALTDMHGTALAEVSTKVAPRCICRPVDGVSASGQLAIITRTSALIGSMKDLQAGGSARTLDIGSQADGILMAFWCGDDTLLVARASSTVQLFRVRAAEGGRAHAQIKPMQAATAAAFCKHTHKLALADGNQIRLISVGSDLSEMAAEAVTLDAGVSVECLAWSPTGQLLLAATASGTMHCFLGLLPVISAVHGGAIAHMTALTEATVSHGLAADPERVGVPMLATPHFMALNGSKLIAAVNNCAHTYDLDAAMAPPRSREYPGGTIDGVQASDTHVALRVDGRVVVHSVDAESECLVPHKERDVTAFALTDTFLILATSKGQLQHYGVRAGAVDPLNEYRHSRQNKPVGIEGVWAAPGAVHVVCSDASGTAFLFSPVNDQVTALPELSGRLESVVFQDHNPSTFLAAEAQTWHLLAISAHSVAGTTVTLLKSLAAVSGARPLVLGAETVVMQLDSGRLQSVSLAALPATNAALDDAASDAVTRKIELCVAQSDLQGAWQAAACSDSQECWRALAHAALSALDVPTAVAAFRKARDSAMVLALEKVAFLENRHQIAGEVLAIAHREYDAAQQMLLRGGDAEGALQMRRDLKHWATALRLAERVEPASVADVMSQHAATLEMKGDAAGALQVFRDALEHPSAGDAPQQLRSRCEAGMARCMMQAGDVRGGVRAALALGRHDVLADCAAMLEAGGTALTEAAELWQACGQVEKAAALFIKLKAFAKAEPLMRGVKSPKLTLAFARAKEAEGRFLDAAAAFERGGDVDAAVRLHLHKLSNPAKAYALARASSSPTAAAAVAKAALQESLWPIAVEFLVRSGEAAEAWQVAQIHGAVDAFAAALPADAPQAVRAKVAQHYQGHELHSKAAEQFRLAGSLQACIGELVAAAGKAAREEERDAATSRALELISQAPAEQARRLARTVLASLGSADQSRCAEQLVDLNLALGNRAEAASAAAMSALSDQKAGNYKAALAKLLKAAERLRAAHAVMPPLLLTALESLHSYMLVKPRVAAGDHLGAARLLKRVADSISRFESHAARILTSAVLQCLRAGLPASAHDIATALLRPENREQLQDMGGTYRRKIEGVVRKPSKDKDLAEERTACCWCGVEGGAYDLACASCQNGVPFCIATGKRMLLAEWTQCSACHFPANIGDLRAHLEATRKCPLCNAAQDPGHLMIVPEPLLAYRDSGSVTASP